MPVVTVTTKILAPIELCFDLARSIDPHVESTKQTRERAVAGVITGLIGRNEEVTWEATHFGVRQRLTSRITAFDRPRHFRDSMARGIFTRFDHDHFVHAPSRHHDHEGCVRLRGTVGSGRPDRKRAFSQELLEALPAAAWHCDSRSSRVRELGQSSVRARRPRRSDRADLDPAGARRLHRTILELSRRASAPRSDRRSLDCPMDSIRR